MLNVVESLELRQTLLKRTILNYFANSKKMLTANELYFELRRDIPSVGFIPTCESLETLVERKVIYKRESKYMCIY